MLWRNRLQVAQDTWGKHPRELEGEAWDDAMMIDFVALALINQEERI